MAKEERMIRVFVSSTFRDMHAERDVLVKKVFPQLRKLCEERGVTWAEIDLRWGITDEQKAEGQVLPLCLEEIRRSSYFIGLLGDRYGWIPEPDSVLPDLVAVQPWLQQEVKDGTSVTELEILHGALNTARAPRRAYFYFRDAAYVRSLPPAEREAFAAENAIAANKLTALKQRIREAHDERRCQLREGYADPEQLGEWVLNDYRVLIDRLYPPDESPEPLDTEAAQHAAYARSRRLAFIGREELLGRLNQHAAAPGRPLLVTGESGAGKSALLAEWAARWRTDRPEDLVIEHYVGTTRDSADWQALVQRILGELKRSYGLSDPVPHQPDTLRAALTDWLAKLSGERRTILVLDALDQLSQADTAHQLGWLPSAFPQSVRVVVSSGAGDTLDAARRRQWHEVVVPLFSRASIAPAARAYFKLFAKTPDQRMIAALEAAPAAANALYLRAVLEELRQFGGYDDLPRRTEWYLAATGLPLLFDRILERWENDFGHDSALPDLVRRTLCLIACARFGLSESELMALLGQKTEDGDVAPPLRRAWTPFYLAAENSLSVRAGLLDFGHEHLRAAVRTRYLQTAETERHFRLQLIRYFSSINAPTDRAMDELPALLRRNEQWFDLKVFLARIHVFLRMRSSDRRKWDLQNYWVALHRYFDPGLVYQHAIAQAENQGFDDERLPFLLDAVATFHFDAGDYRHAEPLARRALQLRQDTLGPDHEATVWSMSLLGSLLMRKGEYDAAEPLLRHALEARERALGPQDPQTLFSLGRYAQLLAVKRDLGGAERLCRRALSGFTRAFGPEDHAVLVTLSTLAEVHSDRGDHQRAARLGRQVLEVTERVLGPLHPETLTSAHSLSHYLFKDGDYAGAERLLRRVLAGQERVLGPDHPATLVSAKDLAILLRRAGDLAGASLLLQRVLRVTEWVAGPKSVNTLSTLNELGAMLADQDDLASAEPVARRVLEGYEETLGPVHYNTLTALSNLAVLLHRKGEFADAEPLYRRAIERLVRATPNTSGMQAKLREVVDNYVGLLRTIGFDNEDVTSRVNAMLLPLDSQVNVQQSSRKSDDGSVSPSGEV